ncbi:hypothetical protein LCGC14_0818630 [marine sediment metagenome]|uniref:Glycosyl transferase family 1 domain-containing protein n=1 Tax=marine sediment metagenome TaxID=412755 RepID=A0A0F9Q4T4_9ZZZZ
MANKKRQILQICHSYSPPFLDCARQYATLFKKTEFAVTTVFLTGKADESLVELTDSDHVIFLETPTKKLKGLKRKLIKRIRSLCAEKSFELCIAHRTKPTYLALLATKLPVISVHHAFGDFERWGRRLFINFFVGRLLLVGVSNAVRNDIKHFLPQWPDDKIQTIYNHININDSKNKLLQRSEARQRLSLNEDVFIMANVGRLHPDKDQKTLISAFCSALPELPANTQLLIFGKGKLEGDLKQLVIELKIQENVKFMGHVKDVKYYFKAFDLFILTSDNEPFGMVLLEALVAGLPIISSDCGGAKEVVETTGTLFPFADEEALSGKLIDAVNCVASNETVSSYVKLKETFSDEAVTELFWDMDFIKKTLD